MTTSTDDRAAFLRTIVADPEDDTVRLAFADWLDENDDPARAEFIRVQVELARIDHDHAPLSEDGYDDPDGADCAICDRLIELRPREDALLTAHRAEWLNGPACAVCGGRGKLKQYGAFEKKTDPACVACHGAGDAGGLVRDFYYTLTAGDPTHNRRECSRVDFARGFPFRVIVPRLEDAITWERVGNADDMSDRRDEYMPTPWLAAVCRHHPVTEIVCLDTVPWEYVEGGTVESYQWWDRPDSDGDNTGNVPVPLFEIMWQEWKGSREGDSEGRWLSWKDRSDAVDALAEAIVTFATQNAQGDRSG